MKTEVIPDVFQLRAFYVMLGIGTLAHEENWYNLYMRKYRLSIFEYYDIYKLLLPVANLASEFALLSHVLLVFLCGLMIVRPRWGEALAYLMLPVIILNFFVQGTKPANHLIFLVFIYSIHGIYGLLRLWGRLVAAGPGWEASNRAFLRYDLLLLLFLTYWIAGVAKLNPVFFTPATTVAADFVWMALKPLNKAVSIALGSPDTHPVMDALWYIYGVVGIVSTLAVEFGLPFLLLARRTRRWGLVLGLFFHLLILFASAIDFSMVCLSIYPLILAPADFRAYLRDHVMRPTRGTVLAAGLVAAYLILVQSQFRILFEPLSILEYYRHAHTIFVSYLLFSMIQFARLGQRASDEAVAPAEVYPQTALSAPRETPTVAG